MLANSISIDNISANDIPNEAATTIDYAIELVTAYAQQNAGKVKLLVDYAIVDGGRNLHIIFPQWVTVLATHLKMIHGAQKFPYIMRRVMHELIENYFSIGWTDEQKQMYNALINVSFQ